VDPEGLEDREMRIGALGHGVTQKYRSCKIMAKEKVAEKV